MSRKIYRSFKLINIILIGSLLSVVSFLINQKNDRLKVSTLLKTKVAHADLPVSSGDGDSGPADGSASTGGDVSVDGASTDAPGASSCTA